MRMREEKMAERNYVFSMAGDGRGGWQSQTRADRLSSVVSAR